MWRCVVVLGFAWPFGVALVGVGMTAAGTDLSDTQAYSLFYTSFLGVPIAIVGTAYSLPRRWPMWVRVLFALLTVPIALAGVYLALIVFTLGYIAVGGYIPA